MTHADRATYPTVVCVLRSGGEYKPEHVRILRSMIRMWWPRNSRLRFVCLTDFTRLRAPGVECRKLWNLEWRGWWSKLELFSAAHDDLDHVWYFDLDTIVVGNLLPLLTYLVYREDRTQPILLSDFYHPERVNSGLMYLPKASRPEVQARVLEYTNNIAQSFAGDGDLLDSMWRGRAERWQAVLPGHVVSYKVHIRRTSGRAITAPARIICFHGQPRPWDTALWVQWALPTAQVDNP